MIVKKKKKKVISICSWRIRFPWKRQYLRTCRTLNTSESSAGAEVGEAGHH